MAHQIDGVACSHEFQTFIISGEGRTAIIYISSLHTWYSNQSLEHKHMAFIQPAVLLSLHLVCQRLTLEANTFLAQLWQPEW